MTDTMETTPTTTPTTPETTIDAQELARVLGNAVLFTGKDRTRPILTHVRIDIADQLTFTATDSYALLVETCEGVIGDRGVVFVVNTDAAQVVKMAKGQKRGTVSVWNVGDVTTFRGDEWSVESRNEGGYVGDSWPKTDALWPAQTPGIDEGGVGIGLMQLARLGKVVLENGSAREIHPALRFKFQGNDLKPMVAEYLGTRVLVMPCKIPA